MAAWEAYLPAQHWPAVWHIVLAALLGSMIGLEGVWAGQRDDLQATLFIALAGALFTIVSINGFPSLGSSGAPAVLVAQLVTATGFVAVVLESRRKGRPTRAPIWLAAAVGLATGAGVYALAICTTLATVALLLLLQPVSRWLAQHGQRRRSNEPH